MNKSVIIIGGGVAGMEAAASLCRKGIEVMLIEKENRLGGHLRQWDRLFPTRRKSDEVFEFLENGISDGVSVLLNTSVKDIQQDDGSFRVALDNGTILTGNALLLATGFELFDSRKKEEYGYGIYDNVITSAELELKFRENKPIRTWGDKEPKRIGIVHCVGSRDEKAGNLYCSKVCCITGVKQAIEIKKQLPQTEVFCFYMDLRMFDRHFEELYLEAQQKWGIQFIRGRLSEAAENADRSIVVKVEDTLSGLPLKMNVDILILLAGFIPSPETKKLASMIGLSKGEDGFLIPSDEHVLANSTLVPGVFLAGAVKGPVSIEKTIADARSAAVNIINYLTTKE